MRYPTLRIPVFVFTALLYAVSGHAQTSHLRPIARPVLPRTEVVLTLQARPAGGLSGAHIAVQNDQLIVQRADGVLDAVPLATRTMRDVLAELRSKYPSDWFALRTNYPLSSTRRMADTPMTPFCTATCEVEIRAASDIPDVTFGFGLVMSPPAQRQASDSGLLSGAGTQLDVIGGLQVLRPRSVGGLRISGQARLALASDQQLSVTEEQSGNAGTQVETLL